MNNETRQLKSLPELIASALASLCGRVLRTPVNGAQFEISCIQNDGVIVTPLSSRNQRPPIPFRHLSEAFQLLCSAREATVEDLKLLGLPQTSYLYSLTRELVFDTSARYELISAAVRVLQGSELFTVTQRAPFLIETVNERGLTVRIRSSNNRVGPIPVQTLVTAAALGLFRADVSVAEVKHAKFSSATYLSSILRNLANLLPFPPTVEDEVDRGSQVESPDAICRALPPDELASKIAQLLGGTDRATRMAIFIVRHYGPERETLQDIGDESGLSRERVRQIIQQGSRRLKRRQILPGFLSLLSSDSDLPERLWGSDEASQLRGVSAKVGEQPPALPKTSSTLLCTGVLLEITTYEWDKAWRIWNLVAGPALLDCVLDDGNRIAKFATLKHTIVLAESDVAKTDIRIVSPIT